MKRDSFLAALESLHGDRAEDIRAAIARVGAELRTLDDADHRAAIEALCSVFFVDTHDQADLDRCVDEAVAVVASGGERAVPTLLGLLQGTDLRSHLLLARALGRIGGPALPALRRVVATDDDPYVRTFALQALAHVADRAIAQAIPEICGALQHPDKEVRDSAARAIGKVAAVVDAASLSPDRKGEMFEAAFRALSDAQPAVRAKAVRALGRMANAGYLTVDQSRRVDGAIRAILGEDEDHEWDRAFLVRREAAEARRLAHRASAFVN